MPCRLTLSPSVENNSCARSRILSRLATPSLRGFREEAVLVTALALRARRCGSICAGGEQRRSEQQGANADRNANEYKPPAAAAPRYRGLPPDAATSDGDSCARSGA